MADTNDEFVDSMLKSAKKKNGPMPPEKVRELSEEDKSKVDNFMERLRRGKIK